MQTDKFKFLSAAARKITVLSEFKSNGSVAVSIQESLAKLADNAYPFWVQESLLVFGVLQNSSLDTQHILSSENHCEITTASISHLYPLLSSIIAPKYIVLRPARSPGGGDTSYASLLSLLPQRKKSSSPGSLQTVWRFVRNRAGGYYKLPPAWLLINHKFCISFVTQHNGARNDLPPQAFLRVCEEHGTSEKRESWRQGRSRKGGLWQRARFSWINIKLKYPTKSDCERYGMT